MTADSDIQQDGATQAKQDQLSKKRSAITKAWQDGDIGMLKDLASSAGGLVDDTLRAGAWPVLLGCAEDDEQFKNDQDWRKLPKHADEEQVQKDVDRAFVYYPSDETQHALQHKRVELFDLIVKILRTNPTLHYFQGYHDIAQVLLLVLGEQAAFTAVSRVSLFRIRDYMLFSLGPAMQHLQLIPAIVKCSDPGLAEHLSKTPPYFALSAVLTLYAHDIQEYADIARLYDFILAHEPVMTIYLFATLIISRKDELLKIDDHDMLLFTLSKLPQPLDLDRSIDRCLKIYGESPPEKLPERAWQKISSLSVLKTSRGNGKDQTLNHARYLFEKQSKQLAQQEFTARMMKQMSRHRGPIISVGATIMVGILSYYLRRNGHDRYLWQLLWRGGEIFRRP